jgi:hypothetical protein
MRILSIRNPWALLIVLGLKGVENRDWKTSYRGPVLIHSGKKDASRDPSVMAFCLERGVAIDHKPDVEMSYIREAGKSFALAPLNNGGVIGIADLVDCVSQSTDPWFQGKYGLIFKNARLFPFTPYKGQLGLCHADPALVKQLGL